MTKILLLAANPKHTSPLRLDEELRDLEEGLRRAQHRDIQRVMLDESPQIVHFSGHGAGAEGLGNYEQAIGLFRAVGDRLGEANPLLSLGYLEK